MQGNVSRRGREAQDAAAFISCSYIAGLIRGSRRMTAVGTDGGTEIHLCDRRVTIKKKEKHFKLHYKSFRPQLEAAQQTGNTVMSELA